MGDVSWPLPRQYCVAYGWTVDWLEISKWRRCRMTDIHLIRPELLWLLPAVLPLLLSRGADNRKGVTGLKPLIVTYSRT